VKMLFIPLAILTGCKAESQSSDTKGFEATAGADFRSVARDFLFELNPSCELTKHRDTERTLAKFENDWATLKRENSNKPLAIEIAISEADSEFEISQRGVPDCPTPDTDGKDPELANRLWKLDLLMATLNKIKAIYPQKSPSAGN
jgi:hypothetical protein